MSEEIIKAEIIGIDYQPATISADFDDMRARLDQMIEPYQGLTAEVVASMDLAEAKKCRADLKSMQKELNDARIAVEKEYNKPFKEFKAKVDELIATIRAPWELLDSGIKEAEELEKRQRREELEALYNEFAPFLVPVVSFEKVLDPRWLNKTYGQKKAENALCEKVAGIKADLDSLKQTELCCPAETEAKFFETLSLRDALAYDKQRAEEMARIEEFNALTSPVMEEVPASDPTTVEVNIPLVEEPPIKLSEDDEVYRFTITVPTQYFVTNINEAQSLKQHLKKYGIEFSMKKSPRPVEVQNYA